MIVPTGNRRIDRRPDRRRISPPHRNARPFPPGLLTVGALVLILSVIFLARPLVYRSDGKAMPTAAVTHGAETSRSSLGPAAPSAPESLPTTQRIPVARQATDEEIRSRIPPGSILMD